MTIDHNLELSNLARILVLVGALILIVVGLVAILVAPIVGLVEGLAVGLGRISQGVLQIIIGFIALLGHRQLRNLAWTIVILLLGVFAGGLGGGLLIIGALIALVITFIKTQS